MADDEVVDLGIPGIEEAVLIGTGGSASVYRARQSGLHRLVAVKVIQPTSDEGTARRFDREARALGRLSEHPGIVTVHDIGTTSRNRLYLVMQFCPGGSLRDRLVREGPLPEADARQLMAQVCDALAAAHAQGIVHRDLKPANVLIGSNGEALVADFGIASLADVTAGASTALAYTPSYAPPETMRGEVTTASGDVYSVGASLFHLLAGRVPFANTDGQPLNLVALAGRIATEEPEDPRAFGVSGELADLILAAMAKDPSERPSIQEVAATLRHAESPSIAEPAAAEFDADVVEALPTITRAALEGEVAETVARRHDGPLGPALEQSAAVGAEVVPEGFRSRRSRIGLGAAVVAAVVGLVAAAGLALSAGSGDSVAAVDADPTVALSEEATQEDEELPSVTPTVVPTATPVPVADAELPSEVTPYGGSVDERWHLEGGRLTSTIDILNDTDAAIEGLHVVVVPSSVASDVDSLAFDPAPSAVIEGDDPTAVFDVELGTEDPPFTITWSAEVETSIGEPSEDVLQRLLADRSAALFRFAADVPDLRILEPQEGSVTFGSTVVLRGRTDPDATVSVAGDDVDVNPDTGRFRTEITRTRDRRQVVIVATDPYGRSSEVTWLVRFADPAPTPTPQPAPQPTSAPVPASQSPSIALSRGGPGPAGYWYSVDLSAFAPNQLVTLTCRDTGAPGGFWNKQIRTNSVGSYTDRQLCYSGGGPVHWVTSNDGIESNRLNW
ncbi:MAG: serine/threonine-protein kinase [Acidimicrobiales bacterium]